MATRTARNQRRGDALSTARIVAAAVQILDAGGETALTFRALGAHLATGPGAIYHHVADKDELLAAATGQVVAGVTAQVADDQGPREAVRAVAAGVFDAIAAHPWVGAELSRAPWQDAVLEVFEAFGGQLTALGVPQRDRFDAASTLVGYVLGLAAQYAAAARLLAPGTDRSAFLDTVAARWTQRDPVRRPFAHQVADQLAGHDDRQQFLAGIDLILAGIETLR